MNCDICGRTIAGAAFKVRVEGAKMLVCGSCKNLGKPYHEEERVIQASPSRGAIRISRVTQRKAPELPKGMEEFDIAENYSDLVRRGRMKLELSQETLAKRVKEKLSVIQKIEMGKIAPEMRLCRELEHELKIKLLIPRKEAEAPRTSAPSDLTLGDIIRIKGKP